MDPTTPPPRSHPTRREFLGTAAALAAGTTVSSLAAPPPEAAQGATSSTSPAGGGGDDLRVAVIGTGARGSDLIRALTTIDGVRIVGLADDYEPHLTKAAAFAGAGVQTFADYRRMLERVKPQAVVIAVPLALHFPIAADALQAGCDVYLEKMMCYTLDEARRLAALVAGTNRVFQVGLQRRASAIYDQALAMVQSGLLGQVSAIKSQWHRNNDWRRPVPLPRADPRWADLEHRLNWRLYRASSRGLLAELGTHQMDVANWVLGVPPRRVWATGGIDFWRDGREVEDNVFCVYEYELPAPPPDTKAARAGDKPPRPYTVRVTYSSLCNNAYEGASELIMGTKGTLLLTEQKGLMWREPVAERIDWTAATTAPVVGRPTTTGPATRPSQADVEASVVTAGKTLKMSNDPWAARGKPIEIDSEGGDDTRAALSSFLDHVRDGDPKTVCDARAGLVSTATILMAIESMETGRPVEWPKDL